MSASNTFNPSDYESLLKSLTEGNSIAKSQSLKRFNILVGTDKKQFAVYAKRIVVAIQDLMFEQKEDINLLAATLTLEIINLNPKDIEYYIRTKLLKQIVINLGDSKPQVRKTSHYSLLALVKTFKNFDEVINSYLEVGFNSDEPQRRQKCINSFQSILLTQTKIINWASIQFKKAFQLLLQKLKDQNPYVQKAAEQCLLTIGRMEQSKLFLKRLTPIYFSLYKIFCENQKLLGNLEVKIQPVQKIIPQRPRQIQTPSLTQRSEKSLSTVVNMEKINLIRQDHFNKQAIIDRIEQIRKKSQTPKLQEDENKFIKKKENSILKETVRERRLPSSHSLKELNTTHQKQSPPKSRQPIFVNKQKIENIFGKKILEDLKNQKDWKTRLQAIQELQTKFEMYKQAFDIESLMKNFVPILVKLLADANFKIALISLKIIEDILKLPLVHLESIVPQVIDKLNDNKVGLRQNVSKLIRSQYLRTDNQIWISCLIDQLKKSAASNIREEVLNILTKLYQIKPLSYPYEKVIEQICPLMDDLKTKIKIRALDLLVLMTIKVQKVDNMKSILMGKLNQVYYEMYAEKVGKELKSARSMPYLENRPEVVENFQLKNKGSDLKVISFPSLKKIRTSATTTTSLQKYSNTVETSPINRSPSLTHNERQTESYIKKPKLQKLEIFSSQHLYETDNLSTPQRGQLTASETVRKKPLKNYKKKLQRTLESKLMTNYTTQIQNLQPLSDSEKQLKNIMVDIKSEDWQKAFDSLTKLRRIIHYHQSILHVSQAKLLAMDIMKHVQSLRSSLSKNAVITINQLSNCMKNHLDAQLDMIFTKLVRKTLDTNSFISEQVKKALISVCCNSNENKVISLLFSFHNSKALPIKQTIIYILELIAFLPKIYQRELQRIIQILVDFMNEGSLEIREKTKMLLNKIIQRQKINSKIYKLIPFQILDKLKKKQTLPQKIEIPTIPSKKQLLQVQSQIKKKKQKILTFPMQFNDLQDLLRKCESNEWKIRQQNISNIIGIIRNYPQEITQYKMSSRIMDVLSKQMNDPNSKVALNALNLFKQITPSIARLIENNLSIIINELFNSFSSHKSQIREIALDHFDIIAQNIQKWMLVQHLCNGALYGAIRSRPSILVKLLKILPECYRDKRAVVTKNVYGMINKLMEENKSETQPIIKQLVNICLTIGGDEAYSSLKQQAKDLIS